MSFKKRSAGPRLHDVAMQLDEDAFVYCMDRARQERAKARRSSGYFKEQYLELATIFVRLARAHAPGTGRTGKSRSGLRSLLSGDRLVVTHVSNGSPAEAAGWRVGEEIVAVNGWRTGSPEFTDELSYWDFWPAGTVVQLTMADGTERELSLADYH